VPTASETAIALGLTLGAAVVGGLGARWMADRLGSGPRGLPADGAGRAA
jgi:hypothetical protein